jgi:hypothetical protein
VLCVRRESSQIAALCSHKVVEFSKGRGRGFAEVGVDGHWYRGIGWSCFKSKERRATENFSGEQMEEQFLVGLFLPISPRFLIRDPIRLAPPSRCIIITTTTP